MFESLIYSSYKYIRVIDIFEVSMCLFIVWFKLSRYRYVRAIGMCDLSICLSSRYVPSDFGRYAYAHVVYDLLFIYTSLYIMKSIAVVNSYHENREAAAVLIARSSGQNCCFAVFKRQIRSRNVSSNAINTLTLY